MPEASACDDLGDSGDRFGTVLLLAADHRVIGRR